MRAVLCVLAIVSTAAPGWGEPAAREVPAELWQRIDAYVGDYFGRVRTIVGRETTRLQPLNASRQPNGHGRILIYDLQIEWLPDNGSGPVVPSFSRKLVKAMGRTSDILGQQECFDPTESSIEPLAILLPEHRSEFTFAINVKGSKRGQVLIEYTPVSVEPPKVTWNNGCGLVELNSNARGRIWVDDATGTVLRVEERLAKPFQFALPPTSRGATLRDSQTLDQLEVSIEYQPVTFRGPDETLMLPKSVRTRSYVYNGVSLLKLQTFDRYRRFLTGGRVVQ